jgi:hypothetical protein
MRTRSLLAAALLALTGLVAGTANTPAAAETQNLVASADSYVDSAAASKNYGTVTGLSSDGSPSTIISYLKFDLGAYAGRTVTSASLKLTNSSGTSAGSPGGQTVKTVGTTWTQTGVTYTNRPTLGSTVGSIGATSPSQVTTVPLTTSAVQSAMGSTIGLALSQTGSNGVVFQSREASTGKPTLVLNFADAATPAPTTGTEAGVAFGWGTPAFQDGFNYSSLATLDANWSRYNGAGHSGNGVRSPAAWTLDGQYLTVTGDSTGTTGGMSHRDRGRTYGRWEVRMRVPSRDTEYHPVLILWPDQGRVAANNCAEIDFSESTSNVTVNKFFLHHSCSGAQQSVQQTVDMTQWHNYAVEWRAGRVTGWIDGVQWFSTTDPTMVPSDPAHLTMQLDWFPDGTPVATSTMQIDWAKVYA